MGMNSVFDIIWTYHQKIGGSLKIVISEFSPEFGREVKGFEKIPCLTGVPSPGSFLLMVQVVHGGFKPLMDLRVSKYGGVVKSFCAARLGTARPGWERLGLERLGLERLGKARQGRAWRGRAGRGLARQGEARF